jgi:hypothetical protein
LDFPVEEKEEGSEMQQQNCIHIAFAIALKIFNDERMKNYWEKFFQLFNIF